MPPEPALSLGSPRTLAAMRVLGILPKDIQTRERSTFPEGQPGDIRNEAFETKRRQLMHSVTGMASDKSLDLTKSASGGEDVGGPSDATNAFLADVMAREQVSIDKMRKRAKADVQSIVLVEMEAKKQVEIREVKADAHRKRMVDLKKKQDEFLKAQKKEAEKKLEKSIEVRARAERKLEEESAALMAEVIKKDARVEAQLKERELGWVENKVTQQALRVVKYDSIAKFKSKEWGGREKIYDDSVKRTFAAEDRLDELQAELQAHQAAKSDKTDGVIAKARKELSLAQGVKDVAYLERIKVHEKKKEVRESYAKETQKEYATANKKARANFEKNYERALKDREFINISPRMTKSMSCNYTTSPAWLTEGSVKAFETHHTMGELRQMNLQMIARAHHFHQNQGVNKIADMRHRVKALSDSREETQLRRYDMMKNCAIEKHHLTFQVEKIRDAPPEKMNSLLEQMGMPPIKTGKEETEEEDKK